MGESRAKAFTTIRIRITRSRINCNFFLTRNKNVCHPEHSEGSMHSDATNNLRRFFASPRMTDIELGNSAKTLPFVNCPPVADAENQYYKTVVLKHADDPVIAHTVAPQTN